MPQAAAVITNPAAQTALERGVVWVLGSLGVLKTVEEIAERIQEILEDNEGEEQIVDPAVLVWLEGIINAACVDAADPQECITAIEDVLCENMDYDPITSVPPIVDAASVDPDEFDIDYLKTHFPILATITTQLANPDRINCTYSKYSAALDQTYYGRTSGPEGDNCTAAVSRRNQAHVARGNLSSFGPAQLDRQATGALGYAGIRGCEQQLIDSWMIDGRTRADVANILRGVAKSNPLGCSFHLASNTLFGPLSPYTGNGSCP